jgi:circadian clock protein KaiC
VSAWSGWSKEKLMNRGTANGQAKHQSLAKAPTGVPGLDEITGGGLPRGRPTLVCGSAGCGKTLLAMEFLVRGALAYNEPGVFMAFEETAEELAQNVCSLGFDLNQLIRKKKLVVDHVHIERSEIEETGEFDLEGLFIRLGLAIDSIGARRVALDTIETLFAGLSNETILRAELRRLFRWLKNRGVTAVITGEQGEGTLTRQGLEEYVSDCVIVLDHRVNEQLCTRRLRVVKYRGTAHGTNEYPFLIDEDGFSVLPITSVGLSHSVCDERISSGIPRLDAMLGGGVYRGSSVLLSGTAGTGKTNFACHFAEASCRRSECCLFLAFEESRDQVVRNLRSIGLDLGRWIDRGLLHFHAARPTLEGLEMHLVRMHRLVQDHRPRLVVVDPISNFLEAGDLRSARAMLVRLVDFLKMQHITAVLTNLTGAGAPQEATELGISSLIDTWMLLRDIELNGERNRGIYVLKSRGMAHSNQMREFVLSARGIDISDVYVGPEGVLTGSARLAQEARERAAAVARRQDIERKQRELEGKRKTVAAQIAALEASFAAEQDEVQTLLAEGQARERLLAQDRLDMARQRRADNGPDRSRRDKAALGRRRQ